MGAELVHRQAKGQTIEEAFNKVYDEAQQYSGHQEGYSGDINSCSFTKDVTSMLKTMSIRQLESYMEDNCPKGEAWGYCIINPVLNKNKTKSMVSVNPQKGTRKWKTVYKAVDPWSDRIIALDESQTQCIKKARVYVEKNPDVKLKIIIAKELVEGNVECALVKYKPSKTEAPGRYKFIGLAPC